MSYRVEERRQWTITRRIKINAGAAKAMGTNDGSVQPTMQTWARELTVARATIKVRAVAMAKAMVRVMARVIMARGMAMARAMGKATIMLGTRGTAAAATTLGQSRRGLARYFKCFAPDLDLPLPWVSQQELIFVSLKKGVIFFFLFGPQVLTTGGIALHCTTLRTAPVETACNAHVRNSLLLLFYVLHVIYFSCPSADHGSPAFHTFLSLKGHNPYPVCRYDHLAD